MREETRKSEKEGYKNRKINNPENENAVNNSQRRTRVIPFDRKL